MYNIGIKYLLQRSVLVVEWAVVAIVVMVLAYVVAELWEWLADRRIEREWARIREERVTTLLPDILAGIRHDATRVVELAQELCVDIGEDADSICRDYETRLARTMARTDDQEWRSAVDAIQSRARWYAARGDSTPTLEAIDNVLGGGR